ncbi:MAG: hypothetical protein ABIJ41_00115 [Candidatus Omnitrophota bacterium]
MVAFDSPVFKLVVWGTAILITPCMTHDFVYAQDAQRPIEIYTDGKGYDSLEEYRKDRESLQGSQQEASAPEIPPDISANPGLGGQADGPLNAEAIIKKLLRDPANNPQQINKEQIMKAIYEQKNGELSKDQPGLDPIELQKLLQQVLDALQASQQTASDSSLKVQQNPDDFGKVLNPFPPEQYPLDMEADPELNPPIDQDEESAPLSPDSFDEDVEYQSTSKDLRTILEQRVP